MLAFISLATRRRWAEIIPVGAGLDRRRPGLLRHPAEHGRRPWYINLIFGVAFTGIAGGDRHVCRRPPRAGRLPEGPGRARRARAGAAGGPCPGRGAHPDRARDARRAGPPDVAGRDACGRARLPRQPDAGGDARGRRDHPGQLPPRAHRPARDPRRAARHRRPAADENAAHRPQPTLCDLDELVDDERAAGAGSSSSTRSTPALEVPDVDRPSGLPDRSRRA